MAFIFADYWLTRPPAPRTPAQAIEFNRLIDGAAAAPNQPVELAYALDVPKWQFLCYLCEQRGYALHGSPSSQIELFEPRQSSDLHAFGAQKAVYAAVDGIWPMYFAIIDRQRHPTSLVNACVQVEHPRGVLGEPHYFFSIERETLITNPWTPGWVYVLPRDTFSSEGALPAGEDTWVHVAQVASLEAVRPLARLRVEPEDFPFLVQTRGHIGERLKDYAEALNQGLPLPEDSQENNKRA